MAQLTCMQIVRVLKFSMCNVVDCDTKFSTVPLLRKGGSFQKASASPLFLEDENFFQKSASILMK
jgi:hypothetical protein